MNDYKIIICFCEYCIVPGNVLKLNNTYIDTSCLLIIIMIVIMIIIIIIIIIIMIMQS